jgi:5-methylcytosine-specific restriction endonuclease McrA
MVCSKCSLDKDLSLFYIRETGRPYKMCKECWKVKGYKWNDENRDRVRELCNKNRWKDLEKSRERERRYRKKGYLRKKLQFKIQSEVFRALRGNRKAEPTFQYLEYPVEDLVNHLEFHFKDGMSWDNYGEWHIDHIKPYSAFDFSDDPEGTLKEAWQLHNIQPLWARENLSKGSKYD